ncbi:MAG: hypothetical protein ACO24Y_04475 [Hylemonella sp.]
MYAYLVALAWLYVVVMMAAAEAASPVGSLLGALLTFVFYGLVPVALLMYILTTPARKRALRARSAQESAAASADQPDAGSHPAADAIAPVRKES